MSEISCLGVLQQNIRRLIELSTPRTNDARHALYVKYINAFLEHFGDERAFLVGSTGENSKLRWSTDGGDSDFVFVSGKLSIPVENIEQRPELQDYVWIRADGIDTSIEVGDDGYLCPNMLKTVSPELFTLLRAVYVTTTTTNHSIPGRVATALKSKVGLAIEEYNDLYIHDDQYNQVQESEDDAVIFNRSKSFSSYIKQRWSETQVNPADKKLLFRILKVVSDAKIPGTAGKFRYFASMCEKALSRPQREELDELTNPACESDNNSEENRSGKVKATYTDKSSMDFVPALRVIGTLPCIHSFRKRVEHTEWPGSKLVEDVCNADVFIVSRLSTINPDPMKDFRLSFNLAEGMLVRSFPPVARQIFIILKSYLKGVIRKHLKQIGKKGKLRSYHLKTIMFWTCEREPTELWTEANTLHALQKVTENLLSCILDRKLKHYIIGSNLIADFEQSDVETLSECFVNILEDPVSSIDVFFAVDSEVKGEVFLSSEEVQYLTKMKIDGGRNKTIDNIEDSIIDLFRGFSDSNDEDGNSALKRAALGLLDVFLKDEEQDPVAEVRGQNEDARLVTNAMNAFVTDGGTQSYDSSETRKRMDLLVGLGSLFPRGKQFLQTIGGRDGLQNILQSTITDDKKLKQKRLRDVVERFLYCNEDEEESTQFALIQEMVAYFLTRDGL